MKVVIKKPHAGDEEQAVFHIYDKTEKIEKAIELLQSPDSLTVFHENKAHMISIDDIYYIESFDLKTYVYSEKNVYQSKSKLFELELELSKASFMRVSKQTVVNVRKIQNVAPYGGGRFEARLSNKERVIISRKYVPELKARFGL